MKMLRTAAAALLLTVSVVSTSYAIAGIGAHWGFDLSMSMENSGEQINLNLPENPTNASLTFSRENWDRSVINFGGKAYIDIIPIIDAIEISCNFGLWNYDGALNFKSDAGNIAIPLGLKDVGLNYMGLDKTPYMKLHLDATIRKNLFKFPPVLNIIKLNAGAGASAHFATPVLNGKMIEDIATKNNFDLSALVEPNSDASKNFAKAVVQKIIDESLSEPVFGMHLLLGTQIKLPIIPVGIYVDGKFMIPFSKFDEHADLKGMGFLVNTGISLSF